MKRGYNFSMKVGLFPRILGALSMFLLLMCIFTPWSFAENGKREVDMDRISLPPPNLKGSVSIEEALQRRRSVRSFANLPLTLEEVSQLVWAAQGITDPPTGFRTSPSAGATFPLEVYLIAGNVKGLPSGIYHYRPQGHQLVKITEGEFRVAIARAALGQEALREAPVSLLIAAEYSRTALRYGKRAERYVQMEAGHAAQNVCLQAVALGLGSVVIGAFDDPELKRIARLKEKEEPLYLIAVGRKK